MELVDMTTSPSDEMPTFPWFQGNDNGGLHHRTILVSGGGLANAGDSSLADAAAVADQWAALDAEARLPKLRPVSGSKLDKDYGRTLCGTGLLGMFLVAALAAATSVLFMNFTFVFPDTFSNSDVPFYTVPNARSEVTGSAERYGFNYFLVLLVALKYVTPLAAYCVTVHASRGGSDVAVIAMFAWLFVHVLFDVGVSIYWVYLMFGPGTCAETNLCRGYTGDPGVANYGFKTLTYLGFAWQLVNLVYFFLMMRVFNAIGKQKELVTKARDAARLTG